MVRKSGFYALLCLIVGGLLWGLLTLADWYLKGQHAGSIGDPRLSGARMVGNSDLTINTFDLAPWTGGHTQANAVGVDGLRSGDHGFFIDFDLDHPPEKSPQERRILWIGGSGAAGWGASTNSAFIANQLQEVFRAQNPCGDGGSLRVVNLAMGGSKTYQNYIALNAWGHALAPDMIVSFSGHNDMDAMTSGGAVWRGYYTLSGLALMTRYDESPAFLKALGQFFPNIARNPTLGNAVRSFRLPEYERKAKEKYAAAYGLDLQSIPAAYELAQREYVHALKSIKRDFEGLTVAIVQQPYMATDVVPDRSAPKTPHTRLEWIRYYERLYEDTVADLSGYINSDWIFFSAHRHYLDTMAARYRPGDGVHLDNAKQSEMAVVLAEQLFPRLCTVAPR